MVTVFIYCGLWSSLLAPVSSSSPLLLGESCLALDLAGFLVDGVECPECGYRETCLLKLKPLCIAAPATRGSPADLQCGCSRHLGVALLVGLGRNPTVSTAVDACSACETYWQVIQSSGKAEGCVDRPRVPSSCANPWSLSRALGSCGHSHLR